MTPPRVPVGDALCVTHRGQVLRCEVTDAATIHRWLSGECPSCSAAVDGVARLLGPEAMIVSTWDALLSRQEARELITWHEAGHAVMAHRVGARVREVVEATDAVYSHCGARRSGGHCQWTGDVTPLEDLGVAMAGLVATQDWLVRHGYDEPGYHVAAVLAAGSDIDRARQELGLGEYIPTALETLRAEWPHRRGAVQRVAQALQHRGRLGEQELAQLIAQAEQDSAPTAADPPTRPADPAGPATAHTTGGGTAMGIDELRAALAQVASRLSEVGQLSRQGEQVADQASGALASIAGASSQAGVQEAVGIVAELATQLSEAAGRAVHASELLESYASSL